MDLYKTIVQAGDNVPTTLSRASERLRARIIRNVYGSLINDDEKQLLGNRSPNEQEKGDQQILEKYLDHLVSMRFVLAYVRQAQNLNARFNKSALTKTFEGKEKMTACAIENLVRGLKQELKEEYFPPPSKDGDGDPIDLGASKMREVSVNVRTAYEGYCRTGTDFIRSIPGQYLGEGVKRPSSSQLQRDILNKKFLKVIATYASTRPRARDDA